MISYDVHVLAAMFIVIFRCLLLEKEDLCIDGYTKWRPGYRSWCILNICAESIRLVDRTINSVFQLPVFFLLLYIYCR